MRKFSLELPKYRLQVHMHLVKRRKPLLDEPILPTPDVVNKKYRSGTLMGKVGRYISEHKNARKIFAGNLAAFVIATSFLPIANAKATPQASESDETVIEAQTTLSTQKAIQLPLADLKINQGFSFFHPAVDLGADIGDPIKPVKAGVVVEAGYETDGYGNTIVIDHGNGLTSRYAHLSKIEVTLGEHVNMDTEIGRVGITGHTTGPHLHLEIRENGSALNPLTVIGQ